jgi:hypothetical protein
MTDLKVIPTPLKVASERDHEAVGKLIEELNEAYKRGEVVSLVFAYMEPNNSSAYAHSKNMEVRDFSYLVSVLQWKLIRWLGEA